ncbi:MAG: tetratricopeptide repeat protein [Gemmatimonadota bacterium]|nr:tetratricopeptide repeat protein [Gemmatimonadota bacterium]
MTRFQLRTLGPPSLTGPDGSLSVGDPFLLALLVRLAVAGDTGVSEGELMLLLFPDATAEKARAGLTRLLGLARQHLGADSTIVGSPGRYTLAPGVLSLDVRLLPGTDPSATECTRFLEGFALPGSPEFRHWLSETRRRVEPCPPEIATNPLRRQWGSRGIRIATGVVLAAAVLGIGVHLTRSQGVKGFGTGDPILLADVRNDTGDSLFDIGLLSAATIELQQSGRLRLYPRSRLGAVYALMQIANRDTSLSYELAQEVAERDHVRFVLGLQVALDDGAYRVTGRLADVERREQVMETSAMAATKAGVLPALDHVLVTLRQRLGESRGDLADRLVPLPMVTTASLEALRSFAEGSAAWRKGNYRLAGELWHRAVDLDTGFAMAYGALGNWYYYHHDRPQGEHFYGEALKRSNRLSEGERLRLLEGQAGYRGNLDSSLALTRVIAQRYPSVTTWYNLGVNLLQRERSAEAMTAFRTALGFDSTHINSYINLASAANRLNRPDEALRYDAHAGLLDTTALYRNNTNHEWGGTLVRLGRLEEARAAYTRMSTSANVADRALGLRSLGYLALWRGHVDEAIELYRQATGAAAQTSAPLSEARNRLLLAMSYRFAGREREAGVEVGRVLEMLKTPQFEPAFLAMVANGCIRLGRVADAETVLRALRARVNRENAVDRAAESFVSGAISLARRKPDSALALARRARSLPIKAYVLRLEAEALYALGRSDSARAVLSRLLAEPTFGSEGQEDWLRVPLVLGDLLLAGGDSIAAATSYQRFLTQWREAPPSLPDVVAARAGLRALHIPSGL